MPIAPIITFKAGLCDLNSGKVKPIATPGYIYLYSEDELLHFCWRPRNIPLDDPELDLLMLPGDGSFSPYQPTSAENPNNAKKPTNGRIYILKFSSSSQRHLFWLQSRSQHPEGNPAWFSARDLKLGEIVNMLLQGDEVDVNQQISSLPNGQQPPDQDDDETMEDVEGTTQDPNHQRGGSGGAGPGATGGDIREEGEQSREGGADGGRAAPSTNMDANSIIQNFIQSMGGTQPGQAQAQGKLFTTLQDLLTTTSTIPWIDSVDEAQLDTLLQFLPPQLVALAQQADPDPMIIQDTPAPSTPLTLDAKKNILRRVLRSPQFTQSLASLTIALRDGGLPSLSEALNIPVRNGGYMRRGGVPLGGGEAVEVFLEGVRDVVKQDEMEGEEAGDGGGEGERDDMDTE